MPIAPYYSTLIRMEIRLSPKAWALNLKITIASAEKRDGYEEALCHRPYLTARVSENTLMDDFPFGYREGVPSGTVLGSVLLGASMGYRKVLSESLRCR